MNSILRLVDRKPGIRYASVAWFDSSAMPGVRFAVTRMSFGRRIELARMVREIGAKAEFLSASANVGEKLESAMVQAEIHAVYLKWGLAAIEGLAIDGLAATPETVVERGPLKLAQEIVSFVKAENGLSENEAKN